MTFAFAFVTACGDNIHPVNGDGGSDGSGGSDAPRDARDAGKMDAPDATMCPSGDNVCNGVCSDPNTDDHNCGACAPPNGSGTDCTTTGQVCTNGICCAAGKINANGICCNSGEVNSSGHCCASGSTYDNGICCPSGQYNAGGAAAPLCCNTGESDCNGACVNEQTDNSHCGSCSTTCNTGAGEACSNGHCCASPDIYCGGACTDPTTDNNNCGACGNACTGTDTCSSGHCCPSGTTYDSGLCCPSGTVNVGGTPAICCPPGNSNCGGSCVNEQTDLLHCGSCTTTCPTGDSCTVGQCCPSGDNVCGGSCSNPAIDNNNCGACGNSCGANTCSNGLCCPSGTVNTGGICCTPGTFNVGGICCPSAADTNCGGTCADLTTDPSHCGTCANACPGGDSCDSGQCCPTGDNLCNGACSDPKSDPNNCGGCAGAGGTDCTTTGKTCSNGICCATGQYNSGGKCCALGTYNSGGICCANGTTNCNGTCVDTNSNNSNCGSCNNACIAPKTCDGTGNCSATCATGTTYCAGTNTCSDTNTDNQNCGACGTACTGGQTCVNGACGCNTPPFSTNCSGTCVDLFTDPNHCGTCAAVCDPGQTCDATKAPTTPVAICCDLGLSVCGTSCVDFQSDPNNCGSCGNACGTGATCVAGACTCPFGETACGGGCKTTTVDPANCGTCGNVCGAGVNAGKPYCVSNSCVATCPAPLCPYGSGVTATCGDPLDDNKHCGKATTTNPCPATVDCTATGQVCAAGQCVTGITTTGTPAKCVNGGPPIIVPGSGGTTDCAGNLADVSFTFGICSCTDIGPLSRLIQTDAFNSAIGAYRGPGFTGSGPPTGACNTASDCAKECSVTNQPCAQDSNCPSGETCTRYPIPCILHTCAGGGVGTNGTTNDTDNMNIGGDLWVFSTSGEQTKADTNVLEHFYDNGPLVYAKTLNVEGDAHVVGGFSAQGNSTANIGQNPIAGETGTLFTTSSCGSLPSSLHLFGNPTCTQQPVTFAQPCDCTNLIPVKQTIIPYFAANNDDSLIGVGPDLFDNTAGNVRLDLVCGAYYFHTLNASGATITIVVHGHVGLFISGAMRISQNVIFDLDPTATLDIFVGGAVNVSGSTVLGSPAFPRYTRLYIGSGGCTGGGGVCSVAEDCCGGVCSGGTCQGGGGNLGQAMSLSNSGGFNGLVYAGYGTFTHSNPLEMYGSIFTGHYDASGTTTIHYDNGVVSAPNECPPPSGKCDTCADCNNNPCVLGNCQANCTDDAQCCPPLHCLGTVGAKTCQL